MTEDESRAREWREEFPCNIIHSSCPYGTTCLECRDYAIKNEQPHRFVPEFRQRYLDWDRKLFCDNCWMLHRLTAYGAEMKREGMEEAAKKCDDEGCPECAAAIREAI